MNGITECFIENKVDENGNPTGGMVEGIGLVIEWQNGPLGNYEDRKIPNGAFVETVISAAKQRLEFFQDSKFACPENELAIIALQQALAHLQFRTDKRVERNVEGTHAV